MTGLMQFRGPGAPSGILLAVVIVSDDLLRAVGGRLQGAAGEMDSVTRQGGDELVALMNHALQPEDAQVLADCLLAGLREPLLIGGQTVQIGANMGIALHPEHGDTVAAQIDWADLAMDQARAAGRGAVRLAP